MTFSESGSALVSAFRGYRTRVDGGDAPIRIERRPLVDRQAQHESSRGTRTAHILIVHNEAATRRLLAELLQAQGYQVSTAPYGTRALERLHSEPFDLVVCDVVMADGDGLELVVQLREFGLCDMPVILMSGERDSALGISGLDLGADDFLSQPVDPEELLARVRAQLRRSERHLQLVRDSVLDPLTRVLNRRGLAEVFATYAALQSRRGGCLSVLVLDLDSFKLVNDRHGHGAGDTVLSHVGRALAGAVRASDRVARLGGDEFAILMPHTDLGTASSLARRIRALSPVSVPATAALTIPIAFSLGLAAGGADDSLTLLLARADASMYEEKRTPK